MRILREPFLQFLLAGALVFVVYAYSGQQDSESLEKQIRIDRATQQWLYSNFAKQFRRPPTQMEMGTLIKTFATNEVKYLESLQMGLDDRDSIVRRRMMQKFDFLFGNGAAGATPDDETLRSFMQDNADEFKSPRRITFKHIWFSPDRRGEETSGDAEAALVELRAGDATDEAGQLGDRFPFDVEFDRASWAEVRNVLGERFADAVFDVPIDEWYGPVGSGLGQHLVRVSEIGDSELPTLDEIRDQVLQEWRSWKSEQMLSTMIAELQSQYKIEVDRQPLEEFEYTPDAGEGESPGMQIWGNEE